jgi:hypothetical protein
VHPDTFYVEGFAAPPLGTPRKPQDFRPRLEVFFNSAGRPIFLPYPTTTWPHAMGDHVVIRGDPSYVKIATVSEFNHGEAT